MVKWIKTPDYQFIKFTPLWWRPYLRFTSKQDLSHSWALPTRYPRVHSTWWCAISWHHQEHFNSSITNPKICCFTIPRTIRRWFHLNRTSRVTPICYSTGIRDNYRKILWRPHPSWSVWCFNFQVKKLFLHPREHSPLPPSWFQSHYGPQRGIPQGISQLLTWGWLPVYSQTECKVKENWFCCPTSILQTPLDYTTRRRYIFPGHSTVSSFLK